LKPSSVYWYRFTDVEGNGSRIGRTVTAPAEHDDRPVRFAFVSCQNACEGAQNAYRRMIFEDERAPEHDRLGFVLHLGDFIYEVVWYPEDRPQGVRPPTLRTRARIQRDAGTSAAVGWQSHRRRRPRAPTRSATGFLAGSILLLEVGADLRFDAERGLELVPDEQRRLIGVVGRARTAGASVLVHR
jgi:PhoD-like phosphatase